MDKATKAAEGLPPWLMF